MQNVEQKHLVYHGKRNFLQTITNVNGFKLDKRNHKLGQRVFVWQNNEYVKTFKTLQKAYDWCIKQ